MYFTYKVYTFGFFKKIAKIVKKNGIFQEFAWIQHEFNMNSAWIQRRCNIDNCT